MGKLGIYHVARRELPDYDEYGDFVCIAESEEAARHTSPCERERYERRTDRFYDNPPHRYAIRYHRSDCWPVVARKLLVTRIGYTDEKKPRVVCSSFHAG